MDTKLHTAVRYGNADAVLEALKEGLDPNAIGLFKWNPVHEAAHNGERDILRLLIAYKGDVNLQDKLHGNTPLHYAAREENSACVNVLLKANARVDIQNDEGMTCMDLATSLCKDLIQEYVGHQNADSEWKGGRPDSNNNPKSMNGVQTQDKWDQIPQMPEQSAIGHIHLSFEYHKTNLKIRVWQVSDLLLPPPQTSMIESIFVRSYLIPDPVKKTNRRTEDVRVEPVSKDPTQPAQSGIQHIFTPSSFRFDTPLIYMGVTQEIVTQRSLQLEVCMTQKHSHKMFLMAMVHLPLRTAVRRPIREKYPLIPCMNYTIPNNMRVYSAKDIIIEGSSSALNQSLSRSNSSYSSADSPVTARDVQLEGVDVDNFVRRFISVDMLDSDDDDDGVGSSIDVKSSLGKSVASSTATVDVMSVSTDDEDMAGLKEVVGHRIDPPKTTAVNIGDGEKPKQKKKIIPNEILVDKRSDSDSENSDTEKGQLEKSTVIKIDEESKETVVDITKLQGDVVLELDSQEADASKESRPMLEKTPGGKKKIIPPELMDKSSAQKSEKSDDKSSNHTVSSEGVCVYDDIHSDNKNSSQMGASEAPSECPQVKVEDIDDSEDKCDNDKENINDQDEDVAAEIAQPRRRSASIRSGSSSTPVSRPETPVWDFYDFATEEGAETEGDGDNTQDDSKDEASKALGTLQQSLLRLTKGKPGVLETCRVDGPVLPTVMIEDFEMDEEVVEDDS